MSTTNLLALVTSELEVLASLESMLQTVLALNALETKDDLLGGLGLSSHTKTRISVSVSISTDTVSDRDNIENIIEKKGKYKRQRHTHTHTKHRSHSVVEDSSSF